MRGVLQLFSPHPSPLPEERENNVHYFSGGSVTLVFGLEAERGPEAFPVSFASAGAGIMCTADSIPDIGMRRTSAPAPSRRWLHQLGLEFFFENAPACIGERPFSYNTEPPGLAAFQSVNRGLRHNLQPQADRPAGVEAIVAAPDPSSDLRNASTLALPVLSRAPAARAAANGIPGLPSPDTARR